MTFIETPSRPYGPIGLVLSCLSILVATGLACALLAAAAFGTAFLMLGRDGTMDAIRDFNPANTADPDFVKLNIVVGLVLYALVIGAILAAARLRGKADWRTLVAWRPWRPFRGTWVFWTLLIVTFVYSVGADWVVTYVYPESEHWVPTPKGVIWDVLFFALAAIFAPIAEELMFRGWIYTSLRASIGVWAGILVTSVLFALAHWESTHLYALAIFPVGVALGTVREKTGSIAASITFHALYNALASAALLIGK